MLIVGFSSWPMSIKRSQFPDIDFTQGAGGAREVRSSVTVELPLFFVTVEAMFCMMSENETSLDVPEVEELLEGVPTLGRT